MAKPYLPYEGQIVTREQAKALGVTRFFTGQPCKRGHLSQRILRDGCCVACFNARRAAKTDVYALTMQTYYFAHAETIKAQVKARRLAKPDEHRAAREAYYAANKEYIKQRVTEHNARYPEAKRARSRNHRALLRAAEGSHTGDDIKALFVKQLGRCIYCNDKLGSGYHVDHIVALSRGGSNWPSNLQLTCAKCNNRKRATDPIEFARRLGRLV